MIKQMSTHTIHRLVAIGFCQPKFYKKSIWLAAKKLMDEVLCPNKLAYSYDFGRGKGKYSSNFDIDEVKVHAVELLRKDNKVLSIPGYILVSNIKNKPKLPVKNALPHVKPMRELKYISYNEKQLRVDVFSSESVLTDKELLWMPVDDFICQSFVIDC